MNFSDSNCYVFLPSIILLRCLKHFKNYGRVVRPWLGMRTRFLDSLKMAHLETIYQKFSDIKGVFVEKVTEGSPADSMGVRPGDIVTHCDGIPVCSLLEVADILFDKAENSMERSCDRASDYSNKRQAIAVEVVIRREGCDRELVKSIIIERLSVPEMNQWPPYRPRELQIDRY